MRSLGASILQQLRYLAQCPDYRTHTQKPLDCFPDPGPHVKDRFLWAVVRRLLLRFNLLCKYRERPLEGGMDPVWLYSQSVR
jgi:hypothetical protein